MSKFDLFESIIQPSVERIPLMDIQHEDEIDGHACVISHVISRNVFTDFDRKLSRHLAAVRGGGFPTVTVTIRAREAKPGAEWTEGRDQHFLTVPHALRGIARRALETREDVALTFANVENGLELAESGGDSRKVSASELDALTTGLRFCRTVGAFEFLDVTGDFDLLMVRPASDDMAPITIDLYRGAITVPPALGRSGDQGFEGPLYELVRHTTDKPAARAYLTAARHVMTSCKEHAVEDFRGAAEARIHAFDKALAGRPLEGHRLDAVLALVARLRAGLGDDLCGLTEDARITALDWAEAADLGAGAIPKPRKRLFDWDGAQAAHH